MVAGGGQVWVELRVQLVFDALGLDDTAQLSEDFLEESAVHFFDLACLPMLSQFEQQRLCPAEILSTVNLRQKEGQERREPDFSFRSHLLQVRVYVLGQQIFSMALEFPESGRGLRLLGLLDQLVEQHRVEGGWLVVGLLPVGEEEGVDGGDDDVGEALLQFFGQVHVHQVLGCHLMRVLERLNYCHSSIDSQHRLELIIKPRQCLVQHEGADVAAQTQPVEVGEGADFGSDASGVFEGVLELVVFELGHDYGLDFHDLLAVGGDLLEAVGGVFA